MARRDGRSWAFQCKNVRRFGPSDALTEIDKLLELAPADLPDVYVFIVACAVSATTRRKTRERLGDRVACEFWDLGELDHKVKQRPEILREFFQITDEPPSADRLDDDAIEEILRRYCSDRWQRWLARRNPPVDHPDTEHRLDHYVEPHFGILESGRPQDAHETTSQDTGSEHRTDEMKPSAYVRVQGVGDQAAVSFVKQTMLDGDNWLCLVEDAGAGKTVFSLRLEGLFSTPAEQQALQGDGPWLAVRIEQWPRVMNDRHERVFLGIRAALRQQVQASVELDDEDADAVVEYALEH